LLAQRDDRVFEVLADPTWVAVRAPRAWLEHRLALGVVAGNEPLHPTARHPVVTSDLALGPALEHDRVITTRAIDIGHHPNHQGVNDVARHLRTMS
jgi:hypothetical protein